MIASSAVVISAGVSCVGASFSGLTVISNVELDVKLRSLQTPVPARISRLSGGEVKVVLHEPQAGISPGQACVFYSGTRVLGGGWISKCLDTTHLA